MIRSRPDSLMWLTCASSLELAYLFIEQDEPGRQRDTGSIVHLSSPVSDSGLRESHTPALTWNSARLGSGTAVDEHHLCQREDQEP